MRLFSFWLGKVTKVLISRFLVPEIVRLRNGAQPWINCLFQFQFCNSRGREGSHKCLKGRSSACPCFLLSCWGLPRLCNKTGLWTGCYTSHNHTMAVKQGKFTLFSSLGLHFTDCDSHNFSASISWPGVASGSFNANFRFLFYLYCILVFSLLL